MGVIELTQQNFQEEVKNSQMPVLIDFFADWCPPCKMLAPIYEQLSEEFEGNVKFTKVNVDKEQSLAQKFNVESIPVIVMIKDGEEIDRIVGGTSEKELKQKINENLLENQ